MTSAEPYVYYPQYCFHLSPTFNKWCILRATDLQSLTSHPGFEGQGVFFWSNHPILWVRVVGVVVAVDEFYGRRVYTIDDSTGECVECSVEIPKPPKPEDRAKADVAARDASSGNTTVTRGTAPAPPNVPADMDVGMVVDVKGRVKLFRDRKQIGIVKVQRVGSTALEVQFWNRIRDFRRDVLAQPWVLDRREVRRAKKQHLADTVDAETEERRRRRKERREQPRARTDREEGRRRLGGEESRRSAADLDLVHRPSPTKSKSTRARPEGQYDALGL